MKTLQPQTANESAPDEANRSITPFDMEAAIMRAQRKADRQARAVIFRKIFKALDPRARLRPVAVSMLLDISPDELQRRIKAGRVPKPRQEGASVWWPVGELQTSLKSRRAL